MWWWKKAAAESRESASPWISDAAAAAIVKRHGDAGTAWLQGLEVQLADAAVAHGVVLEDPIGGGTTGALVRGVTPGASERGVPEERIVLKASPDRGMLEAEAGALAAWGSAHAVEVIEVREGVLVLECVEGGAENGKRPDAEILPHITEILRVISQTPPHGYTLHPGGVLTKALERLEAYDEALFGKVAAHRERIEAATALTETAVLCGLHGDLHSENTLWRGERLVMIDPFPVTGPLAYDLGFWATDPMREGSAWDRLVALGTEFSIPTEVVWGYGVLGALLHLSYRTHYQVDLERVARAREILAELLTSHL